MTHKSNRKRIARRDISLAIKNDHDLIALCFAVTIPEGGGQPFIHQILLNTNRRRRNSRVQSSQDGVKNSSSNKTKSKYKQAANNNTSNTDTDDNLPRHSLNANDSDLQME
ncbi:unnamed protein product [Rotaria sordida]|uniref:Uncharacterized protein n=1 Tax=Rotaria sordida TaxID=392033 RepID=A0A815TIZ7_9BILA|nr:unnamed protein product [Rotaria sordida]CAF1505857.1 unnamed protein product [Rotaria sordida]